MLQIMQVIAQMNFIRFSLGVSTSRNENEMRVLEQLARGEISYSESCDKSDDRLDDKSCVLRKPEIPDLYKVRRFETTDRIMAPEK